MVRKGEERPRAWVTTKEAATILTERSGHTVSDAYVRRLGQAGKLSFQEIDGRTKLYSRTEVEAYAVKKRGNGDVRRAARTPRWKIAQERIAALEAEKAALEARLAAVQQKRSENGPQPSLFNDPAA